MRKAIADLNYKYDFLELLVYKFETFLFLHKIHLKKIIIYKPITEKLTKTGYMSLTILGLTLNKNYTFIFLVCHLPTGTIYPSWISSVAQGQ